MSHKFHLNKIVNSFKTHQVILFHVDTHAKVKTSVSSVNYFIVPKFHKVCVLCISHCYTRMDL